MKPLDFLKLYEDAEFYDQEFAGREHEIPFYVEQARQSGGPVLELGCGTGRLTLPIARAGIEVTGLDISGPMLERARSKAETQQLKVTWLERDARNIGFGRAFAMIFSATNAMQHLHDLDSVNAFLTSARIALRPGGTLILDVFNPVPAKLARTSATRYHHKTIVGPDGRKILVEAASDYHSASQILAFTLFYLLDGELIRTKNVNLRCFYPEELLAICRFNGFEIDRRHGDYDGRVFSDDSKKQILFCRPVANFKSCV